MKYDLVFEGGGAKGMAFVGAMQSFEARGHTAGRLLGTSAGAITATLLAAGYTSAEMLAALDEKEDGHSVFTKFMGTPGPFSETDIRSGAIADFLRSIDIPKVPGFFERRLKDAFFRRLAGEGRYRHIHSMVETGGWFTADRFVTWMQSKLDSGTFRGARRGFGAMTLRELFEATQTELTVIASDTTGAQILVLNHNTAPDLPAAYAARMSMSIPFVWPEVEWRAEWGRYRDRDIAGHLIVDGGMLSNFPIELLVDDSQRVTAVMGARETNVAVVGLLIDEKLAVPGAVMSAPRPPASGIDWRNLKTIRRVQRLVDTMTQAHDKQVIEVMDQIVVRLPAQGYGTTEFDMSDERRNALVAAGRQAMEAWFMQPRPRAVAGPDPGAMKSAASRITARILE